MTISGFRTPSKRFENYRNIVTLCSLTATTCKQTHIHILSISILTKSSDFGHQKNRFVCILGLTYTNDVRFESEFS